MYRSYKGRNKIVLILRKYDSVYRKPNSTYSKIIRINKRVQQAHWILDQCNKIALLIHQEQTVTKYKNIKRSTTYSHQQKCLLRINPTKDVHEVYGKNYKILMNDIKKYLSK